MTSLRSQRLSIVIPCYNEEVAAPMVVEKIVNWTRQVGFEFCEILVVNDGSTDATRQHISGRSEVVEIYSEACEGYGASLKKGFARAQGDLVLFFDMDDTYQIEDLQKMFEELQTKKLAVVFGNRLEKRSGMPWVRFVGNLFYRHVLRLLAFPPLRDPCTGMRLFRRQLVPSFCQIGPNDFSYSIALSLFILKSKIPYGEVEISYHSRAGISKLSAIVDGWRFFWTILSSR